jgi:hypothetical protein
MEISQQNLHWLLFGRISHEILRKVEKFRNWIMDQFTLEYGAIEPALVQIEYLITNYIPRNYYFIERGRIVEEFQNSRESG